MTIAYAVFGFYFIVIIVGSGFAALSRSLVRALVGLFFAFMGVAGMYLLMQAPFLAFMQLLVYVGAVCVLIFFALMLAKADIKGDEAGISAKKTVKALVVAILPFLVLAPALVLHPTDSMFRPVRLPIEVLGKKLLEEFVLPFELISVILLVAMAGGVFLVWERRQK